MYSNKKTAAQADALIERFIQLELDMCDFTERYNEITQNEQFVQKRDDDGVVDLVAATRTQMGRLYRNEYRKLARELAENDVLCAEFFDNVQAKAMDNVELRKRCRSLARM